MDLHKFDFLDFGAKNGSSIEFAKRKLGGQSGLGVDIDPSHVAEMKRAGYDCLEGDICDLDFPVRPGPHRMGRRRCPAAVAVQLG